MKDPAAEEGEMADRPGSLEEQLRQLESDPVRGLSDQEAERRRERYGDNLLQEPSGGSLRKLLGYFWAPIPWMIEVAAVLSAAVRQWADFSIILTMLIVNAAVGFWQEFKADTAIALLKQKLALRARVLREGRWRELPASMLVPGDIVLVKLGDIIPADLKLLDGEYLSVDQSALTGESLPVDKKMGDVAFSGSIARMGEMKGLVTATGMQTYFGKTAGLVERAGTVSHFQRAVLKIGNFLILSTVGLVGAGDGVSGSRGSFAGRRTDRGSGTGASARRRGGGQPQRRLPKSDGLDRRRDRVGQRPALGGRGALSRSQESRGPSDRGRPCGASCGARPAQGW